MFRDSGLNALHGLGAGSGEPLDEKHCALTLSFSRTKYGFLCCLGQCQILTRPKSLHIT